MLVKGINDLIGKADKPVNIKNGRAQIPVQHLYGGGE